MANAENWKNVNVLNLVIPYIDDPEDRHAVSEVCKRSNEIDSETRKHVTIALCYTTTPARLRRRFPNLESLKLKGKPRTAICDLIPDNWGGSVTPWVTEISQHFNQAFNRLHSLHFRRMIVSDSDLKILTESRGHQLHSLKLNLCMGFSTDGLTHVSSDCRNLRLLFLEESKIVEKDGEWLHHLALNNTVLQSLNFYQTNLTAVNIQYLVLLARNCRSLVSVKIPEYEMSSLMDFFRQASSLEEFGGGTYNEDEPERYSVSALSSLPAKICRLGLPNIRMHELSSIMLNLTTTLTELDLMDAWLDTNDYCWLIPQCPNLEVLKTRHVIGDTGLKVLGSCCKKLKRLRIGRHDENGGVSHVGLIPLSEGCSELQYLAVYVTDITNMCLEHMGRNLRNLSDFRLVLHHKKWRITDPLDNGVRALLMGCDKLKRFALGLRPKALTDVGLSYIGQYSQNVRWMMLRCVGQTDEGLSEFARGCPNLQKLELRNCPFTERAVAAAAAQLSSLRYLWVLGYNKSRKHDLLAMARPFWNIELIPSRTETEDNQGQILAYYSLAGQRSDFPDTVEHLVPEA